MRQEIDKLRSDRRYIEGIARKELGMVRADEMVYQFPTRPAPVKPSGAAEAAPPVADSAQYTPTPPSVAVLRPMMLSDITDEELRQQIPPP